MWRGHVAQLQSLDSNHNDDSSVKGRQYYSNHSFPPEEDRFGNRRDPKMEATERNSPSYRLRSDKLPSIADSPARFNYGYGSIHSSNKITVLESQRLVRDSLNADDLVSSKSGNRSQASSTLSDISERVIPLVVPSDGNRRERNILPRDHLIDHTNKNGIGQQADHSTFPDVNELLDNCECYMNWMWRQSLEQIGRFIQIVDSKHVTPAERLEREETIKWYNLEHVAHLGAMCFFYIVLNKFPEAKVYVNKARDFITACTERDFLPQELLASLDYVWDYLCLYGSVKEWEYSGMMEYFPEMNLLTFPPNFHALEPKVKAGVNCIKNYFYELQKNRVDAQIETLRQAISCDPQYYEWFLCLQSALRYQRIKYHMYDHVYPWDAEIQATWTAGQLAPLNPRCLLAGIRLLAEIGKAQLLESKWTIIRFGDVNFHNILQVKSYMKEQAEKIMKIAPKSVRINTALAQIFISILPYGHRDFRLGKGCLEACLKAHPDSCKANHRMADFYLQVDTNYRRAERYYELAFEANEKSFPSLLAIIQLMLRAVELRKSELLSLLNKQIKVPYWEAKQVACLHFYKGLTQIATDETRDAVGSFITAYITLDKSLAFQDLPSLHRKFGWPGWPATSRLSFSGIRADLLQQRAKSDSARRRMIEIILKHLHVAEMHDQKLQASKQEWRR